jgi:hypothetical protein
MTPDLLTVTTFCWIVGALASLRIALPQVVLLFVVRDHDDLWPYRLKNTLLYGSLATALVRNVLIWADYVWFAQAHFGSIDERRLGDLVSSAAIMVAVLVAAALYSIEQRVRHVQPPKP